MFRIGDLRDTRVYQEALEEGRKDQAVRIILNMGRKKMPVKEIAELLEVDNELVYQVLKGIEEQSVRAILKMAIRKIPVEEMAAILDVDIEFVQQVLKDQAGGGI